MTKKTWIRSALGTFAALALVTATGCAGKSGESSGETSSKVNGSCVAETEDGAPDKIYCSIDTDCDSDEVCMNGKCTGLDGEEEDGDKCEDASDDANEADDEGGADKVVCANDPDCDSDEVCMDGKCTGLDGEEEDGASDDDDDDANEADDEGGADKVVCATDADCDSDEKCLDGKCD